MPKKWYKEGNTENKDTGEQCSQWSISNPDEDDDDDSSNEDNSNGKINKITF